MFKRILIFFLFVSNLSFAQESEEYFVKVKLKDQKVLNKLEEIKATVYHTTDKNLLTKLSEKEIKALKNLNAEITIIKEFSNQSKYYLKLDKVESSDEEISILENPSEEENLFARQGAIEIRETPVTFKNEKLVQSSFQKINSDSLVIAQIVSDIDADSVRWFIQSLQDFKTRFYKADTKDSVANWIKYQFERMGFTDVKIDSFEYQNTWQKNVIATLKGKVNEEDIYVFGGHQDSDNFDDPLTFAPGADDNASGTTAVLEVARVLMKNKYQPEATIKFITFAAEEAGLRGSYDLAKKAYENGDNIRLMINHDMISYAPDQSSKSLVIIKKYIQYESFNELASVYTKRFSNLNTVVSTDRISGSDSYSYYQFGFPVIYFQEYSSPDSFYHTNADTVGNYNMEYCAEVIKASCATLLNAIPMPDYIKVFNLTDVGDGSSLKIDWQKNNDKDLSHYKYYIGSESKNYFSSNEISDTVFVITDLEEGKPYFIGISSIDTDGNESFIVEKMGIPNSQPLSPKEISAKALFKKIELKWNGNKELDFLGYNVYRSENEAEGFEKINSAVIKDTIFIDENSVIGIYNYYKIESIDKDGNGNMTPVPVKTRAVSLDQGILIVDETKDGSGDLLNPTDEQVDLFYSEATKNYNIKMLDLKQQLNIDLSDLGAYSTVLWHGDDNSSDVSEEAIETIKEYLHFGGNFIYAGYRPTRAFENNAALTSTFDSTTFINKYFKINKAEFSLSSRFIGSESSIYSVLDVDSSKTNPNYNHHLSGIESIAATQKAEEIFFFNSGYDSTSLQGMMKGKPVGVQYLGDDYKVIILSFPLYYIQKDDVERFLNVVFENVMREVTPVEENEISLPKEFALNQNYPNPFNPNTLITYQLSSQSTVELKVFDILGREVQTLVNEIQNAGSYKVNFDATNLPSGIYIYQIKTYNYIQSKKMMLVK